MLRPVECGVADFLLIPNINSIDILVIQYVWWAEMCPLAFVEMGQQYGRNFSASVLDRTFSLSQH